MPKDQITAMLTKTPSVEGLPLPSKINFLALPGVKNQVVEHAHAIAEYFRCCTFTKDGQNFKETFRAIQMLAVEPPKNRRPQKESMLLREVFSLLLLTQYDDGILEVLDYEMLKPDPTNRVPDSLVSAITVFDEKMSWLQKTIYKPGRIPFHRAAGLFLTIVNYLHDLNQERGPGLNAVILQANQLASSSKDKKNDKAQSVHDAVLNNFRADKKSLQGLIAAHEYFTELFFSNNGNNNFYPLFQLFVQGEQAVPNSQETLDKIQANIQDLHTFFEDLALFLDLTKAESLSPIQLGELRTKYPHAYTRAEETQHRLFSDTSLTASSTERELDYTDRDSASSVSDDFQQPTEDTHSSSDLSSLSSGTDHFGDSPSSRSLSIDSNLSDDYTFFTARSHISSQSPPPSLESLSTDNNADTSNHGTNSVIEYTKIPSTSPRSSTSSVSTADPASSGNDLKNPAPQHSSSDSKRLHWLTGPPTSEPDISDPHVKKTWVHAVRAFIGYLFYPFKLLGSKISNFLRQVWVWRLSFKKHQTPSSPSKKTTPSVQQKTHTPTIPKSPNPEKRWSYLGFSRSDTEEELGKRIDLRIGTWEKKSKINAPNKVGFREIRPQTKSFSDPTPSKKK